MKTQVGPFSAGNDEKINVAVERPTVNLKQAEDLGEELAGALRKNQEPVKLTKSKHATFGPKMITHPGIEQ